MTHIVEVDRVQSGNYEIAVQIYPVYCLQNSPRGAA